MSDLILVVLKQEKSRIQSEICEQDVLVIFDGTSRLGEALAIVLRFVTSEWTIEQRLIRVELLSKEKKLHENLYTLCLQSTVLVGSNNLLAAIRDRASSNSVSMKTVKVLYPNLVDIGCF